MTSLVQQISGQDATQLIQDARAEKCRRNLSTFIYHGWHVLEPETPLIWNFHINAIADHVQWMLEDWMVAHKTGDPSKLRAQNIAITVPPGTAKSRIVSVFAPAWMWIHYPSWRVLCLSANPRVAMRDSMYCRDVIRSDWYQSWFKPEWKIRDDQDGKGLFGNTESGFRAAQGLTASITGERGDAIFVDDPLDVADAHSEAARKTMLEHWKGAGNRLNSMEIGLRIGIMQRVHEDDWAGHVLRQGYEHLNLPMEFEKRTEDLPNLPQTTKRSQCNCKSCLRGHTIFGWKDPRTEAGQILHPSRFPKKVLDAERLRLGSMGYASQYQQRPSPIEGGLFKKKWIKLIDSSTLPRFDWKYLSVDASFKKTEHGSRVSNLVIGAKQQDRYVVDNVTKHMNFGEACNVILELLEKHPDISKVLIEEAANGHAILSHLGEHIPILIPIRPEGGKVARANSTIPTVEAGHLIVVRAPWTEDFIHEVTVFPMGSNDDQVDSLTQCLNYARSTPEVSRFLSAYE